ncbi:unnamed protein product [Pleuronectes platessa]|uniref:Uncharacterized protein n=1 Tax=Pleuronectes platessa TaxID=8262 RepID=A0A9N7VMV8_PLEPL|nr:unnamed protein product [Pleuronectes platessa]
MAITEKIAQFIVLDDQPLSVKTTGGNLKRGGGRQLFVPPPPPPVAPPVAAAMNPAHFPCAQSGEWSDRGEMGREGTRDPGRAEGGNQKQEKRKKLGGVLWL